MRSLANSIRFYVENIKGNWKSKIPDFLLLILTIIISVSPNGIIPVNKFLRIGLILGTVLVLYLCKICSEAKELQDLKGLKSLETKYENISQTLNSLPTDYLKLMYRELKFSNAERISLYIYDEDFFKIIGRYSSNPVYNKINREEYPTDEGFISKCWENNNGYSHYFIEKLPVPPSKGYNREVQKNVQISDDTLNKLTMKSRSYYIRTITNDGEFEDSNGVIVLETMSKSFKMPAEEISSFLKKQTTIPLLHRLIEMNSISGGEKYQKD